MTKKKTVDPVVDRELGRHNLTAGLVARTVTRIFCGYEKTNRGFLSSMYSELLDEKVSDNFVVMLCRFFPQEIRSVPRHLQPHFVKNVAVRVKESLATIVGLV